jgi:hypothetical protein
MEYVTETIVNRNGDLITFEDLGRTASKYRIILVNGMRDIKISYFDANTRTNISDITKIIPAGGPLIELGMNLKKFNFNEFVKKIKVKKDYVLLFTI